MAYNTDSDSRLNHSDFLKNERAFDQTSTVKHSAPSGGGGMFGSSSSSSSSSSSNSSSSNTQEEETTSAQQEPIEEEEAEETQQLVSLTKPLFESPTDATIDSDTSVQVNVEYLADQQPKEIHFNCIATFNGEEEVGSNSTAQIANGVAKTSINLPMHMGYYHKENKTDQDKIEYSFKATCPSDNTEIVSEAITLPDKVIQIDIIEAADKLFNSNSAVPLLDPDGLLVASLKKTFAHAKEWPDKQLVVYGHTDTTADNAHNFTLSEHRATALKALIEKNSSNWNSAIEDFNLVLDHQMILNALHDFYDWSCHCGEADGISGAKTEAGIKTFQKEYNNQFSQSIGTDGTIGPQTWGALMETIHHVALEDDENTSQNITFGHSGSGIYPCGESFPIEASLKNNYESDTNRRCELGFHDTPNAPTLTNHGDTSALVTPEECQTYDLTTCALNILSLTLTPPSPSTPGSVTYLYPENEKTYKHYVNFDDAEKNNGENLTVEVKTPGVKDGKTIFWKVTKGDDNSPRTTPEVGLLDPATKKLISFTDTELTGESVVKDEVTSMELVCGLSGGDTFKIEIGVKPDDYTLTVNVENWRKLWYQLTIPEKMTKPKLDDLVTALGNVFIELDNYHEEIIKLEAGPKGSWVDGKELGKADERQLVIGSHNKDHYHGLFDDSKTPLGLHFAFGHHQLDTGRGQSEIIASENDSITLPDGKNVPGISFNAEDEVEGNLTLPFKLEGGGNPIIDFTWSKVNNAEVPIGTKHPIPDQNIIIDFKNYSDYDGRVFIQYPEEALKYMKDTNKDICIEFDLYTAQGWYLGESDGTHGNWLLIAGDRKNSSNKVDHKGMCGTMVHELGHAIQMVVDDTYSVPGIDKPRENHGRWYKDRGHSGDHCADGVSEVVYNSGNDLEGENGTCVMFGESDSGGPVEFCDRCKKHILPHSITSVL